MSLGACGWCEYVDVCLCLILVKCLFSMIGHYLNPQFIVTTDNFGINYSVNSLEVNSLELKFIVWNYFQEILLSLNWFGLLDRVLAYRLKGLEFNSGQGHVL